MLLVQCVPVHLQLPHIPLRDALTGIKSASASSVSVASASAVAFGLLDSSRANCAETEPNLSYVMSSILSYRGMKKYFKADSGRHLANFF